MLSCKGTAHNFLPAPAMQGIVEGLTSPAKRFASQRSRRWRRKRPGLGLDAWTGIRSSDRSARVRAGLPKEFRQVHERTRITGGPELRFEVAIRTGSCDAEMVFPKRTPTDGVHRLCRSESKCRTARRTVNNLKEQQDASLFMLPLPPRIAARAHRSMLLLSMVKQLFCGC